MSGQQPPMQIGGRQQPHPLSTQGFSENQEDFYRSSSAHPSEGDQHQYNGSSISPADSQTPIVKWSSSQPTEYLPPPGTAEYTGTDHSAYPSYDYPLPTHNYDAYRSSMEGGIVNGEVGSGAVNGEIGGGGRTSIGEERGPVHPITPLSAGFKTPTVYSEEDGLKNLDETVAKHNRRDTAIKLKIRLVKVLLRGVNCACSVVVLSLLASTFAIFNATKDLPKRNNFSPWPIGGPKWPQIVLLVIAIISLLMSLSIMWGYWRGGHKKAEKQAFYATLFAGGVFLFSIVMWGIGIGIMQGSRNNNNAQDIWGWACKSGPRKNLFSDTINFNLVCRQNNWVTVCGIIEICVETITIGVYIFAFYRLHSKQQLRKSMQIRDQHRSNIWLNKLKEEQAVDAEEDHETTRNTLLNSQGVFMAESGRAVPILQRPPPGHHAARDIINEKVEEEVPPPPQMPAASNESLPPATPRTVSFQAPPPGIR